MKKLIYLSAIFLVILSLCYFLLFISLDITAMFMKSDDDINKTGKTILFFIPVTIIYGLWIANCTHDSIKNNLAVSLINRIFISIYGGLFGMVISDLFIKLFLPNRNEAAVVIPSLLVSFIVFFIIILALTKKYLTKQINADR